MQIDFPQYDQEVRHQCVARREGDWAVFSCPFCPDFERRMNLRTGTMKTRKASESFILHEGFFIPPGLENTHSLAN